MAKRQSKSAKIPTSPPEDPVLAEIVRRLVDAYEPERVYLFGSHARGEVRHASDIDIAILPRGDLPHAFFADLADKIEESTIPYDVDLVDLREVEPGFRQEVLRTGIKWRD